MALANPGLRHFLIPFLGLAGNPRRDCSSTFTLHALRHLACILSVHHPFCRRDPRGLASAIILLATSFLMSSAWIGISFYSVISSLASSSWWVTFGMKMAIYVACAGVSGALVPLVPNPSLAKASSWFVSVRVG